MKEWGTYAQFRIKKQNNHTVDKGSPNNSQQVKSGPRSHSNRLTKVFISSGRVDILSIMKKQYIYETFVDLVECILFRNSNIM